MNLHSEITSHWQVYDNSQRPHISAKENLVRVQPTFSTCNSSLPHITFATNDQHSSSSCKGTSGLLHIVRSNNNYSCCFKGVTYVAIRLHRVINWEIFFTLITYIHKLFYVGKMLLIIWIRYHLQWPTSNDHVHAKATGVRVTSQFIFRLLRTSDVPRSLFSTWTYRLANTTDCLRTSDLRDEDKLATVDKRPYIDTGDGQHRVSSSCGELTWRFVRWEANNNITYHSCNRKKRYKIICLTLCKTVTKYSVTCFSVCKLRRHCQCQCQCQCRFI